ncbi:aminotransferase class IV [Actinacidiphila sp. ITFR-21]|uniref:aminotransferase class IV n=1 Tax=Actinacidiphila sp. ITFR-21 TaxID=3075199 RepID=UPI002889B949|nr:aminotransferase class IV [Streptomyces sp. ITFR-21]WNI18654.1 aminotransferase class IV [Streptomyces sp. ITFR-21]
MTTTSAAPVMEIDGAPATAETLAPVLAGYGHFTAMQVRGGRVRGAALHAARLDAASRELFGTGMDGGRFRGLVRHALASAGRADASVRVNVFQPKEAPGAPVCALVTVGPPAAMEQGPYRLKSVSYQRPVAHLKHVGGFGQGYHVRRAAAEGCQEALLTGPDGLIAEGAVTNIGFVEGGTVVWPAAPMLRGITLQVMERELTAAGVPQTGRPVRLADVGGYDGAFVLNSRGMAVVRAIDTTAVPVDAELLTRIRALYDAAPWDAF